MGAGASPRALSTADRGGVPAIHRVPTKRLERASSDIAGVVGFRRVVKGRSPVNSGKVPASAGGRSTPLRGVGPGRAARTERSSEASSERRGQSRAASPAKPTPDRGARRRMGVCDDVVVSVDLRDVSLVTGARRGIGRLLAVHLARSGSPVVAVARPSVDLDSLNDDAPTLTVRPADVTDPAAVRAAFAAAVQEVGQPTTVITCAGSIDSLGSVADVDPDRWWSAVAVDLRGTMLVAQAALKWMLPLGRGRIVTVYGNLGDRGTPNLSAFSVAKAGIARLTETLANEVHGTGVVVVGMHPGFVRTPMTEHRLERGRSPVGATLWLSRRAELGQRGLGSRTP